VGTDRRRINTGKRLQLQALTVKFASFVTQKGQRALPERSQSPCQTKG
jgi:hypothetical protein